ncbi:iron ABC transporter permease [Alicyclobacillus sp. SO9]|uniref:FecCD family ABC transporter permease n=1 Tax=Alicyclobacillus sp. SO9 TaxID=2665646 RepID=UPI0018E81218|nr:iron ABC transporter permease [Alicyclobacillus sp. SO9]QQE79943.1 iron ABC transporter permease [Alicyclobacillus sp. SO9]
MKRLHAGVGITVLSAALVVAAFLELDLGPMHISVGKAVMDSWAYFSGQRTSDAVVMGAIRWPRLVVAAMVGAGLASTGAALQAVFRNPMADPAIIGVSGGASLGAVVVISLGLASRSQWWTPAGAFVTGLVAVFLIYRLGTIAGRTAVHSLLLSGVAVSSLSSALVTLALSLSPLQTMQAILFWLMGGLDGSTWGHALMITVFSGVGLVVYLTQARALDILSIGEEQAEGVGVPLQSIKQIVLITAAFVVAACVSVSGVIGFVGLIVPHLIRIWMGPVHRVLIAASAIGGAVLLVLSDVIARTIVLPQELNVGIITSCLGAPFFLYLLRRQFGGQGRKI